MQVDLQVSQSAFSIYHLTRENSLHSPRINSTQLYSLEKNKSSLHGLHFIFCPLYGLPATFYWKFHQHHGLAGRPRNFLHGAAAAVWRRRAVLVDLEPHCAGRQRREAEHEGPRLGRVAERMPGNILILAITSG